MFSKIKVFFSIKKQIHRLDECHLLDELYNIPVMLSYCLYLFKKTKSTKKRLELILRYAYSFEYFNLLLPSLFTFLYTKSVFLHLINHVMFYNVLLVCFIMLIPVSIYTGLLNWVRFDKITEEEIEKEFLVKINSRYLKKSVSSTEIQVVPKKMSNRL